MHTLENKNRIVIIDALRGFAIAAILLIHTSNHFLYHSELIYDYPTWLTQLDSSVINFLYFIFENKANTFFALLFGVSYAIQLNNQKIKGRKFAGRMAWRMLILILFGIINACFHSGGDPLIYYALIMLCIIPLRNLSTKLLCVISVFFLLQPMDILNHFYPFLGDSHVALYTLKNEVLRDGNFMTSAYSNVVNGLRGCLLWAIETGRFTQTIGIFLMGIIFFRTNFFTQSNSFYAKNFIIGFVMTIILYFIKNQFNKMPWFALYYHLAFFFALFSGISFLFLKKNSWHIWKYLSIYGKMSLSNFIAQSVIGSMLFYPWGLNLGNKLGVTLSVSLAIGVLILQISFSKWWLSKYKRGPLETIWHKLTWININNK